LLVKSGKVCGTLLMLPDASPICEKPLFLEASVDSSTLPTPCQIGSMLCPDNKVTSRFSSLWFCRLLPGLGAYSVGIKVPTTKGIIPKNWALVKPQFREIT
jgi:hypothetical protein